MCQFHSDLVYTTHTELNNVMKYKTPETTINNRMENYICASFNQIEEKCEIVLTAAYQNTAPHKSKFDLLLLFVIYYYRFNELRLVLFASLSISLFGATETTVYRPRFGHRDTRTHRGRQGKSKSNIFVTCICTRASLTKSGLPVSPCSLLFLCVRDFSCYHRVVLLLLSLYSSLI